MKLKILFLLKRNYNYNSYSSTAKAGLINSVIFLTQALEENSYVDTKIALCVDGNSIDKEVHDYQPHICIMDAIWVTPTKIKELTVLHPDVLFIIRIHSKVPFLGNEGMSITWIKEYAEIENVIVSSNNPYTTRDFRLADIPVLYLPNIYKKIDIDESECIIHKWKLDRKNPELWEIDEINIGCFGAIRPLKNQLLQAFAAMHLANKYDIKLKFHINASRVEQKGEEPLKNLRALFQDTPHELVEHSWMTHDDFLEVVNDMDLGLQCSYSESYNIVAADFVDQRVPIVVSDEIYWMQDLMKVNMNDSASMVKKMETAFNYSNAVSYRSAQHLNKQRRRALYEWNEFLNMVRINYR